MSDLGLLVFALFGKIFIFTAQKFPIIRDFQPNTRMKKFLRELCDCDFCLGVWIYTILSALFHVHLFSSVLPYFPFISELATGTIISMIMHLISIGWKEKFSIIKVG